MLFYTTRFVVILQHLIVWFLLALFWSISFLLLVCLFFFINFWDNNFKTSNSMCWFIYFYPHAINCFLYFEGILLATYIFMMIISSCSIYSFCRNIPLFSLICFHAFNTILLDIKIVSHVKSLATLTRTNLREYLLLYSTAFQFKLIHTYKYTHTYTQIDTEINTYMCVYVCIHVYVYNNSYVYMS